MRAEAIRIATAARVLFHDTRNSRSLIRSHLGFSQMKLRSTAVPVSGPNSHFPGFIGLEAEGTGFRPYGDDSPRDEQVEFEKWWSGEPILKLPKSDEMITRKQLILAAANTDGGAHVDTRRSTEYERLEAGLNIQLVVGRRDGTRETVTLRFANLAALRQIGHEILTSNDVIDIVKAPLVDPWSGEPMKRE
ncbi:MAG: hypothetical protein DLM73_10450 [Chthoniobacterales bacterium]|nr:MAG: hypothetical protein DLM73_10450 [Chthoniobacterales bacterium]